MGDLKDPRLFGAFMGSLVDDWTFTALDGVFCRLLAFHGSCRPLASHLVRGSKPIEGGHI